MVDHRFVVVAPLVHRYGKLSDLSGPGRYVPRMSVPGFFGAHFPVLSNMVSWLASGLLQLHILLRRST